MIKKLRLQTAVILLFFSAICAVAEQLPDGKVLGDAVSALLTSAGFSPVHTELAQSEQKTFPYNITLTFPAGLATETTHTETRRSTIIIVFSQKDVLPHRNEILPILFALRTGKYPFTVITLFSAPGCEQLPGNDERRGPQVFVDRLDEPDNYCALIVHFAASEDRCTIIPGSGTDTAPDWFVKSLSAACTENNFRYTITSGNLMSLYRFGILKNDSAITPFLKAEIPAAGIKFPTQNKIASSIIESFLHSYKPEQTKTWDRHYSILQFAGHEIWLSESFFVICYLVVAGISLFILCGFSFIAGKDTVKNWKDFGRSWYLLPVTILLSAVSLHLGQILAHVVNNAVQLTPVLQFGIKQLVAFLFVSYFFIFEIFYKGAVTPFIYGFQVTIMSVINIFIFSAIDLSFFFLFTSEYILIYFTRPAKRLIPLILSALCVFIPFIPYSLILWKYADPAKLEQLVYGNFTDNILLACACLPFYIMWLRIFSRIIASRLNIITLKTSIQVFASIVITGFFICLAFVGLSKLLMKYRFISTTPVQQNTVVITPAENTLLKVSVSTVPYPGIPVRQIEIRSAKQAVRYEIHIAGDTGMPIYDSAFTFRKEGSRNTVYFPLPDWPPQHVNIPLTVDTAVKSVITVTAVYQSEQGGRFFTSETCSATGTDGN